MQNYPHHIITGAVDGIARGAEGVVGAITNGLQSAGNQIQSAVDAPFRQVLSVDSPTHVPGDVLDGVVGAAKNAINNGVIGSAREVGHGINRALDRPLDAVSRGGHMRMPRF